MRPLIVALTLTLSVAAAADTGHDKPLVPGKWYAYKKDAPFTAACKNPSFVAQANRILRENIPDPRNTFKQEGCFPDWWPGMGNDPLDFKFKVVRVHKIDGKTIVETARPQYYPALRETIMFATHIDQDDIDPTPVRAPTDTEIKSRGERVFGKN